MKGNSFDRKFAAILKLFILVMILFIIWTMTAFIVSVNRILPEFPIHTSNSPSLAQSLVNDILRYYFSPFTISVLILLIGSIYLSFRFVENTLREFISLTSRQRLLEVFLNRFFLPVFLQNLSLNPLMLQNSKENILGPVNLLIKSDHAALVKRESEKGRFVLSNGKDALTLLSNERLMAIFNLTPGKLKLNIGDLPFNQSVRRMTIFYRPIVPQGSEMEENQAYGIYNKFSPENLRYMVESAVRLEFEVLKNEYTLNHIMQASNSKLPQNATHPKPLPVKSKRFLYPPHFHRASLFFIRARKRRIAHLSARNGKNLNQLTGSQTQDIPWDKFFTQLKERVSSMALELFGAEIITLDTYQLGE